jgi:hypothetical protein
MTYLEKRLAKEHDKIFGGPLHFEGELLAALAPTAQRTGRSETN